MAGKGKKSAKSGKPPVKAPAPAASSRHARAALRSNLNVEVPKVPSKPTKKDKAAAGALAALSITSAEEKAAALLEEAKAKLEAAKALAEKLRALAIFPLFCALFKDANECA